MRAITIRVTRTHINEGWKSECAHCPVALAVSEAFGIPAPAQAMKSVPAERMGYVTADYGVLQICGREFALPERVAEWMIRFDRCGSRGGTRRSIRPLTFTLIHPLLPPIRRFNLSEHREATSQ